jgi:hypothetical protein
MPYYYTMAPTQGSRFGVVTGMAKLTNQEVFTKVVNHLLRPDFVRSVCTTDGGSKDVCLYAGPNGNSCAIGCLLPRDVGRGLDRLVNPSWPSVARNKRSAFARQALKILRGVNAELLNDLQMIHDGYVCDPEHRARSLRKVAVKFDLVMPESH